MTAAPKLLAALRGTLYALDENIDGPGPSKQTAIAEAHAAIDEAAGTLTFTSRNEESPAAPAILEALRLAQRALNTAPRFRVGDTDSYKIAAIVDEAIREGTARREPL
jgi:hypothetical protein